MVAIKGHSFDKGNVRDESSLAIVHIAAIANSKSMVNR